MQDKEQEEREKLVISNRAELLHYNLCFGDQFEVIKQFNEVRQLNLNLSKPVMHISLSLAPEDKIEKGKMNQMVEECAEKMGFQNNQYVAVYHKDTNHQHLHIVVNRVGFDGKTLSDSHNFGKIAAYCRKMELKYQLKQVLSPRRYLSEEQRLLPRQDIRKELLKERINQSISQSKSYLEFEYRMKQLGYDVIRGRGIAFQDKQKVYVKGSEVGYSLSTIENKLKLQLRPSQNLTQQQKKFLILEQKLKSENNYSERPGQKLSLKQQHEKINDNISEGQRHNQRQQQILEILMRPVEDKEQMPYQLKKSKRKRQYQHQQYHHF
jgi:hypothetical protein